VLPLMPECRPPDARLRPQRHHQLYAALDVAWAGARDDTAHRAEEFAASIRSIRACRRTDVHVVLDNSTHKTPSIQRWLVRIRVTPIRPTYSPGSTSSSWSRSSRRSGSSAARTVVRDLVA
jgi:hypothetical protein